jgi:hypothetical protein
MIPFRFVGTYRATVERESGILCPIRLPLIIKGLSPRVFVYQFCGH